MYMYVCRSASHNSQKVETDQLTINGWVDKQTTHTKEY